MTIAHVRINLDVALLPSEMMLKDLLDPTKPAWLAQLLRVHVSTICDICADVIPSHDHAYYEQNRRLHPAHPGCWVLTLPERPVRVAAVRYPH